MSRFFFHILTDPGDGDVEFDTSIAVGNLAVDLDGSPSGLSFTQVNDGYYFEYTVSGLYTISISAVDQDEFTDIPLVADEDNITSQNFQSVDGYIYLSGGYARIYTDGSSKNLHAGDIIDDDTTGGSSVPASAEIVKTLGAEIDAISVPTINTDISTGNNSNVVGAEVLKDELNPNFSQENVVSESKTIVQNIDALDVIIGQIKRTVTSYREVIGSKSISDGTNDDAAAAFPEHLQTSSTPAFKERDKYYKRDGDTELLLTYNLSTSGGGSAPFYIDGVSQAGPAIVGGGDQTVELSFDISGQSEGLHYVELKLAGDDSNQITLSNVYCEIKTVAKPPQTIVSGGRKLTVAAE